MGKKKPGGTKVGNFLRKISHEISHGLLGTEDGTPKDDPNDTSDDVTREQVDPTKKVGAFEQFWNSLVGVVNDGITVRPKIPFSTVAVILGLMGAAYFLFFRKKGSVSRSRRK